MNRPSLLFYCQHSLGLGHLVRSLALADGLAASFDVTILNGGRLPEGTVVPTGVEIVNLPPLGHDDQYELISHDPGLDVETAQRRRVEMILSALSTRRPAVLLIELFPFGRKKFAFELEPLLEAARSLGSARPMVVCSVRDILVGQRRDQARHDERASVAANLHLDAILVHADPAFARLKDSFRPHTPLRVPVHYTGFVAPPASALPARSTPRLPRVLVSVGGGMVGGPLLRLAVQAHEEIWRRTALTTTIVAGPFLPLDDWDHLTRAATGAAHLQIQRRVANLAAEIAHSTVSVSQGGYNTTMDLLRARVAAVVVPYAEGKEDEQTRRAERLHALGAISHLPQDGLTASGLADRVVALAGSRPSPVTLDLGGRETSARIAAELVGIRCGDAGSKTTRNVA